MRMCFNLQYVTILKFIKLIIINILKSPELFYKH